MDRRASVRRQALERFRDSRWGVAADQGLLALRSDGEDGGTPASLRDRLLRSDTGRAGGLAVAVMASNVLALAFTIVFARLLGATDYGALAVLISAYIILMVPGSALQIAVAREVSAAVAADDPGAGAGLRHWLERLALLGLVVTALAIPLREAIGATINVQDLWAAAAIPLTSVLWMILSVERGALQGFQRYKAVGLSIVGEAATRIGFGLLLVAAGLGVTGAFLGTALSLAAMACALGVILARRERAADGGSSSGSRLRDLLAGAWIPVVGLTLLFTLQEVHVIIVRHEASGEAAGSYAVAAVAAKAIIWVAVGLGLYLLPEAARRSHSQVDARPILMRTVMLIAAVAAPMLAIYFVAAEPLLRLVFGPDLVAAASALPWLGVAMTLLACAYLSVQFLLALGRSSFVWVLGVAAAVEVLLLAGIGARLLEVALALAALQLVCAATMLTLSLRTRIEARAPEPVT